MTDSRIGIDAPIDQGSRPIDAPLDGGPRPHVAALDLFTIGIGPSSSHTVGPMRAARRFTADLAERGLLDAVARLRVTLYGSIASTGPGHGTPGALVAGLEGSDPATCDPKDVAEAWDRALAGRGIRLSGRADVAVPVTADDLRSAPLTRLPRHPNALRFEAFDATGAQLASELFYSIGGGFIEREEEVAPEFVDRDIPFPYGSAVELLEACASTGLDIAGIALANETATTPLAEVERRLDAVWQAMRDCVELGMDAEGVLPGWLAVPRRAADMARRLHAREAGGDSDTVAEWLQCYAIAVNEQNAAGGRVVTAPTNGAAGIIPAVGYYAAAFRGMTTPDLWRRYLLTAGAIGALCKMNASISGAEAGCQGEVGSACSMAAAGITAVLGGTPEQVENAAEVAMEHHLGLTCDPIGGFVQVPCIERNAIAAGTAVAAMRLALLGDGTHLVSLDTVIETMRQTGRDMSHHYKETSLGGLAVNVVEC
ncbi:MAG: hypothetical protein RI885_239 [Actinomycetota bacterium]